MSIDQLTTRIEAIACRYVREPVRQLDLTEDVLKLFAEYMRDERDARLAQIDKAFGEKVA